MKDENDVVELWVRHALKVLDEMWVIDNGSTDGTREILAALVNEGLPVQVVDDPRPGHTQDARITSLYETVLESSDVDFMIPLDADEFLGTPSRAHLEQVLDSLPGDHCGLIAWKTHILRTEDMSSRGTILERMEWTRKIESPNYEKVVIPTRSAWSDGVFIGQGSHQVHHGSGSHIPYTVLKDLPLRHYPVRSMEQLQKKVATGWLAYLIRDLEDPKIRKGHGYHKRAIYELLIEQDLTVDDLYRISVNYAEHRPLLAAPDPDNQVKDPIEYLVDACITVEPRNCLLPLVRQYDKAINLALNTPLDNPRSIGRRVSEHLPRTARRLLRQVKANFAAIASTRGS